MARNGNFWTPSAQLCAGRFYLSVGIILLSAVSLSLCQIQIDLDCPQGWQLIGHGCYKLYQNDLSWTSAESVCKSYGGHLATPADFKENEDLGSFVNSQGSTKFWIGADRIGVAPNYRRVLKFNDGQETRMWVGRWAVDQPSFNTGDCAFIQGGTTNMWGGQEVAGLQRWELTACGKKLPFLCQRPVCSKGSFHCSNGHCLNPALKCDGEDDCRDRSDELDCPNKCFQKIKVQSTGTYTFPASANNPTLGNVDCVVVLEADVGKNIELRIDNLSLAKHAEELVIMDGGQTLDASREVIRLTGSLTSQRFFFSYNNLMILNMLSTKTNAATEGLGTFQVTYQPLSLSAQPVNTLVATDQYQELGDPIFSDYELGSQDLRYVIQAQDPRRTVTVEILEQDLAPDSKVLFRDGDSIDDKLLTTLRGTYSGNHYVLSSGRELHLTKQTMMGGPHKGIKLRYMQGCGLELNQTTGFINSPGFQINNYPNAVECRWDVTHPDGKQLTIKIENFNTRTEDKLEIYDENSNLLKTYSGVSAQSTFSVASGKFSAVFAANAYFNQEGFNISFSEDCPEPDVDAATSTFSPDISNTYGSSFTVTCNQGNTFLQEEHKNKSQVLMVCGEWGRWNVNTSPKCMPVLCPKAPGLENGYIASSTGSLAYKGTITYECYQGFAISGDASITCQDDGTWTQLPTCQTSRCNTLPSGPANGNRTLNGDGSSYGSLYRFSCEPGYDLIGDTTMLCDSSGQWVGTMPTCRILTCYTPDIPHGSVSANQVNYLESIELTCDQGYRTSVNAITTMSCNADRTLTPQLTCLNIDECAEGTPCNTSCVDQPGSYKCECNAGYIVSGNLCIDINECESLSPCEGTCNNLPGLYTCGCSEGYALFTKDGTEGHFLPAGEDGTRDGDKYMLDRSCVPVQCNLAAIPENTHQMTGQTVFHFNDTVEFKCKLGYRLADPSSGTLVCGVNGTWEGPQITCQTVTCDVESISSLSLVNPGVLDPPNINAIEFGKSLNIACNVQGFGTFTRTRRCTLIGGQYQLDGSAQDFECGVINCGQPASPTGTKITDLTGTTFGNTATFGCDTLYSLSGESSLKNATISCQANGQWDLGSLYCSGKRCTDPGQIQFGVQKVSDYRTEVVFECTEPGFELQPPGSLSCELSSNGTTYYNASLPSCVDVNPPVLQSPCANGSLTLNVAKFSPIADAVPTITAIDAETGIKELVVSPGWPSSQQYISSAAQVLTFTYTFKDFAGNQAECKVFVKGTDNTNPSITCPDSVVRTFSSSSDQISVTFFKQNVSVADDFSAEENIAVTFQPPTYLFKAVDVQLQNTFPRTRRQEVIATAMDESGRTASCKFDILFTPDVCSQYHVRQRANTSVNCQEDSVTSGVTCTVTCEAGYRVYGDLSQSSVTFSCPGPGQQFNRDTEVMCVNVESGEYEGTYQMLFDANYSTVSANSSCYSNYQEVIQSTLDTLGTSITPRSCYDAATDEVIGSGQVDNIVIDEGKNQVSVRYKIVFKRVPGIDYSTCSAFTKIYLEKARRIDAISGLWEFQPSLCPSLTLVGEGAVLDTEGYFCADPNRTPSIYKNELNDDIGLCLKCPAGTFKVADSTCVKCPRGTYSIWEDVSSCTKCSLGASTYREGAPSNGECTGECSAGTYNSETGLPPCAQCPKDTYRVNSKTCDPCPGNQITKVAGANSVDECIDECPPGSFNEYDGHEPCSPCPLHTYSNNSGVQRCTSCEIGQYTETTGTSNASLCLDLNDSTECTSRCQNGQCVNNEHTQSCNCESGYTGENCSIAFDHCKSSPCQNGGTCLNTTGIQYICECPPGTTGEHCDVLVPTCTDKSCLNNGMCENLVGAFKCHCLPGFSGSNCNISSDLCIGDPCKNGGTCEAQENVRYTCTCPAGFTGVKCETIEDQCYSNPCQNNGVCTTPSPLNYICDCKPGFGGTLCETRQEKCETAVSDCGSGAWCLEDEVKDSYICVCPPEAEYKDPSGLRNQTCEKIDFCDPDPCVNGGICSDQPTNFICACPTSGVFDGHRCQHKLNTCKSSPCQNGGVCTDLSVGYSCNCTNTGYKGPTCATEIDECATTNCSNGGQCVDKVNGFECQCKNGFSGDTCEVNVDECAYRPCRHNGSCVDEVNDHVCECPEGWTGRNCEEEVKFCMPSPCDNGAECNNLFNDYFCRCKLNTFGVNCSESVKVCDVANPCVHGTCKDEGGVATCSCPEDYTGDRCEERVNPCFSTTGVCQNEAVCVPTLDQHTCQCQPGYEGPECATNRPNCGAATCLVPATCIDLVERAVCRCPLGREGPLCIDSTNSDFDLLFRHSERTSMAALEYPIPLSSSSFSVSMWIQFADDPGMGVFFSIFVLPSPNSLKGKKPLLSMNETFLHYYDPETGEEFQLPQPIAAINDGRWHYLVINVNGQTGQLHYIADTIQSRPVSIPSRMFDLNLWVVLGCMYDPVKEKPVPGMGFYGKLSRVMVFERTLKFGEEVTDVGNVDVSVLFSDSILRWGLEFALMGGVQRLTPSLADSSCQWGFTGADCRSRIPGKTRVEISAGQCPADILRYSTDRLTEVTYAVPTFSGQADVKTSLSTEDVYVWGRYPVIVEASNNDGNTALCLFNIYVQNDQCTTPPKPPRAESLLCLPQSRDDYTKIGYQQCGIKCEDGYAPSIPGPHLHTCGPSGNWDPENQFVPYRLSPCGQVTKPKQNLVIVIRYSVPSRECQPIVFSLTEQVRATQVALNTLWDRLCAQNDCSDTIIAVVCLNARRKRQAPTTTAPLEFEVRLTLPNIQDTVTNRSDSQQTISPQSLYDGLILSDTGNPFDYQAFVSRAFPVDHTVSVEGQCDEPQVLINGECVHCGPGTFYNNKTTSCEFCPTGSYQTQEGQTSCVPCPDNETTQYYGATAADDCKAKCDPGQYFDINTNNRCENCSRGFYQPESGQFHCLACDADKTTKLPGTIPKSKCANDCPPGQEIGPTNDCVVCTIGFYRSANDALCLRCPAGKVTRNNESKSESDCDVADNPPGTYRNQTDPSKEIPCPVDQYQPDKWQFECLPCDTGFRAESEGSTQKTDCKFFCPAGQQVVTAVNVCEPCPLGTYRDGTKIFEPCDSCPSAYTTLSTGSKIETDCSLFRCPAGNQPNATNTGCEPCPIGQYQAQANQEKCDSCLAGQSTRQIESKDPASCETYCPAGHEKVNGTCTDCQVGYFRDNSQGLFGACTRCTNTAYITASTGATSNDNCTILDCQEGYRANMATELCEKCPKGTYQDKKYQTSCVPCKTGEYTRTDTSTSESDCESYCQPGYEKDGGNCNPCSRGYYKNNDDDRFMMCTKCRDNFVTPEGDLATYASNCTVPDCKPGTYISGDTCEDCPKGQWQNVSWSDSCIQCPVDKDTEGKGSDSIEKCLLNCPEGKQNTPGTDLCEPCPVGYYKDQAGTTECKACDDFTKNNIRISPTEGADNKAKCTKLVCLPGYYPNDVACSPCTYGNFQPYRWNDTCDTCPSGQTTYKLGSTDGADCERDCDAGSAVVGDTCKLCPVGQYRDKGDPTVRTCEPCTPGLITGREGATSASECTITDCTEPGTYRNASTNVCTSCPLGQFQNISRQDSCQMCPDGYTTRYVRSANEADCERDCPAGQQLNNITGQCDPCPEGSYRSKTTGEDSWTCQPCTDQLTTAGAGADEMVDCNVPTCTVGYGYDRGERRCKECPANTYQDSPGQYLPCQDCPTNQITAGTATTSSDGCSLPCSSGSTLCSITTQVCVDDASDPRGYRCDCKDAYSLVGDVCTHKCNIENYCGEKGVCYRSPLRCECSEGFSGERCAIRPAAASQSDDEQETLVIALICGVCGFLLLILFLVCLCVIGKRRATPTNGKSGSTEFDEHASIATHSNGYDNYPTFAMNPAFNSKTPSVFGGMNGQGTKLYSNDVYFSPDDAYKA